MVEYKEQLSQESSPQNVANSQEEPFYTGYKKTGTRQQPIHDAYRSSGNASQICNDYSPFLFDWDKAATDAGMQPATMEGLERLNSESSYYRYRR